MIGILLAASLCAWGPELRAESNPTGLEQVAALETLPAVFGPLSWTTDVDELRARMPGSEVREARYITYSGDLWRATRFAKITWPEFGDTRIYLERPDGGKNRIVRIASAESRAACLTEAGEIPGWCRNRHGKALLDILQRVEREISRSYGPPHRIPWGEEGSTGYPDDSRQVVMIWFREAFILYLSLLVFEDGTWGVDLQATRLVR